MNFSDISCITFTTTIVNIKEKLTELQFNGYAITSLSVTQEAKVKVIARRLLANECRQSYSDLRISEIQREIIYIRLSLCPQRPTFVKGGVNESK